MDDRIIDEIVKIELFSSFSADRLRDFFKQYRYSVRRFTAEHLVMLRGDGVDSLLIVVEGSLRAQIQGANGKSLRIEVLKAPQPVAAGILFSEDNRLPVSLYAEKDSVIVSIPRAAVLALCGESADFTRNYFTDMGNKISLLAEKIRLYQFTTIKQKIAGYLLGLSGERELGTVRIVFGREVLAEIMSVTRPALSREISAMVRAGIIETEGKTVRIIDRGALLDLAYGE